MNRIVPEEQSALFRRLIHGYRPKSVGGRGSSRKMQAIAAIPVKGSAAPVGGGECIMHLGWNVRPDSPQGGDGAGAIVGSEIPDIRQQISPTLNLRSDFLGNQRGANRRKVLRPQKPLRRRQW